MDWTHRYMPRSHPRTRLQRTLYMAFALFFLFPAGGFIFFSVRYRILQDEYVAYFFLGLLLFSYFGFAVLKNLFQRISAISQRVSGHAGDGLQPASAGAAAGNGDELHAIVESFHSIQSRFGQAAQQLEKKTADISVLKDLSELCYVTFDPEEILYVTLERALLLTDSDLGSVLALEASAPKAFIVKATIGLGKIIAVGDRLDFDSSIAKYAVISKSPLLVEDIEQDKRFGRTNLAHYGAKSFVCMPIKTSQDIIGVLTVSSRDPARVYSRDEIEVLTPMLSNAAFTFENLKLLRENQRQAELLRSIDTCVKLLASSFRDNELLHAVLHELRGVVACEAIVVLARDETRPGELQVKEWVGSRPDSFLKRQGFDYEGSVIENALRQEVPLVLDVPDAGASALDQALFGGRGPVSCHVCPLRTGGVVFGVMVLVGRRREALVEARDLVNWVAGGLALAIDRNRLLAAVAKREQEMGTIRQVGSALASSTFDMSKVLTYTMDMIREAVNVEAGSLLFREGQNLEVAVAFNGPLPVFQKFQLKLGQGIAGYVAARGEAVVVNDVEKSLQFSPVVDDRTGFRTRSALCVPMISQGRVIGVIEVLNKVSGHFDANDRDLLQAIAASVCIALENARLYKETVASAEHERDVRRMFQKFVPKQVVDTIIHGLESGNPAIEEVKTVTLLNIDIRGFSRLARQIGSRRTVSVLNRFFSTMGEAVFRHSGIVDKYLGDGFLAVFGAPVSGTTDAEHAVQAAVDMQRSIAEVNAVLKSEIGAEIVMGISIHTGEVVAGNIGFEKKFDYTVIGDAVNTVFRLQGLARSYPNGILVSETTLRALRRRELAHAVPIAAGLQQDFGDPQVFELLDKHARSL